MSQALLRSSASRAARAARRSAYSAPSVLRHTPRGTATRRGSVMVGLEVLMPCHRVIALVSLAALFAVAGCEADPGTVNVLPNYISVSSSSGGGAGGEDVGTTTSVSTTSAGGEGGAGGMA